MIVLSVLVLIRILSNSFANVCQKSLSMHSSPFAINFNTFFIIALICTPIIISSSINLNFLITAILAGIIGAIGNNYLIAALKNGELSILGPINSYKPVIALLYSFILLNEQPSLLSVAGIALIIIGSYFVFETTKEGFSLQLFKRKDIRYRIYALIFTSFEAVLIKKMIILSNSFVAFSYWALLSLVFCTLLLKIKKENVHPDIKMYFPLAFLILLMQISTNLVFEKMNVSEALSLFQLSVLLNVFLGYKVFKERELVKKIAGSFIMVTGSAIIILNM